MGKRRGVQESGSKLKDRRRVDLCGIRSCVLLCEISPFGFPQVLDRRCFKFGDVRIEMRGTSLSNAPPVLHQFLGLQPCSFSPALSRPESNRAIITMCPSHF